jgi:hypothetical protein
MPVTKQTQIKPLVVVVEGYGDKIKIKEENEISDQNIGNTEIS